MSESLNRRRKGEKCTNRVKAMDLFGENFVMKLDEDRTKNYSFMGVLLSLILLVILAIFTYSKALAW